MAKIIVIYNGDDENPIYVSYADMSVFNSLGTTRNIAQAKSVDYQTGIDIIEWIYKYHTDKIPKPEGRISHYALSKHNERMEGKS